MIDGMLIVTIKNSELTGSIHSMKELQVGYTISKNIWLYMPHLSFSHVSSPFIFFDADW